MPSATAGGSRPGIGARHDRVGRDDHEPPPQLAHPRDPGVESRARRSGAATVPPRRASTVSGAPRCRVDHRRVLEDPDAAPERDLAQPARERCRLDGGDAGFDDAAARSAPSRCPRPSPRRVSVWKGCSPCSASLSSVYCQAPTCGRAGGAPTASRCGGSRPRGPRRAQKSPSSSTTAAERRHSSSATLGPDDLGQRRELGPPRHQEARVAPAGAQPTDAAARRRRRRGPGTRSLRLQWRSTCPRSRRRRCRRRRSRRLRARGRVDRRRAAARRRSTSRSRRRLPRDGRRRARRAAQARRQRAQRRDRLDHPRGRARIRVGRHLRAHDELRGRPGRRCAGRVPSGVPSPARGRPCRATRARSACSLATIPSTRVDPAMPGRRGLDPALREQRVGVALDARRGRGRARRRRGRATPQVGDERGAGAASGGCPKPTSWRRTSGPQARMSVTRRPQTETGSGIAVASTIGSTSSRKPGLSPVPSSRAPPARARASSRCAPSSPSPVGGMDQPARGDRVLARVGAAAEARRRAQGR